MRDPAPRYCVACELCSAGSPTIYRGDLRRPGVVVAGEDGDKVHGRAHLRESKVIARVRVRVGARESKVIARVRVGVIAQQQPARSVVVTE